MFLYYVGYNGSHCEYDIDECQSAPCKNGAVCHNHVNSFTCKCSQYYLGTNCDTYNFCVDDEC